MMGMSSRSNMNKDILLNKVYKKEFAMQWRNIKIRQGSSLVPG